MPLQPAVLGTARLNNFRLDYLSAALFAIRETRVRILVHELDVSARVRRDGLTIQDDINDTPNTAAFRIEGAAPSVGETVRITLNSNTPRLLFNGTLEAVDLTYEGRPDQLVWACSAQDDQARVAAYLPFGTWTTVSATTVVQALVSTFAPAFTASHVEAGLAPVSVIFDGSEGFGGALAQIAKLVGGYYYWEDGDLHFFLEEWTDAPDPIDATHPFLDEPPITIRRDKSQLRTRVYGRGHGESLLSDVATSETILPVSNAEAWFSAGGGRAITDDLRLTYTGVQGGGLGAPVGPGAQPSVAPLLAPAAGTGLGTGVYKYAFTFGTATGESVPSPLGTVTTGPISAPTTLPTLPAGPNIGPGPDAGTHYYGVSFVAGSGETLATISTNTVTTYDLSAPAAGSVYTPTGLTVTPAGWAAGQVIRVRFTASTSAGGETTIGAELSFTIQTNPSFPGTFWAPGIAAPALPTGAHYETAYGSRDGGASWHVVATALWQGGGTSFFYNTSHPTLDAAAGPPGVNLAAVHTVPITTIPIGPPGTTARKIYRTVAGAAYAYGNFKTVATLGDNTTTNYTDTVADASLGAAAPSSNTTLLNTVNISGIATGPSGTTARTVYRTIVNGSQLKLLSTLANNTTTTLVDSTADGSLGANAPTGDTSGLTTATGLVAAGATVLLTANASPFVATGGWVLVGGALVRYTGVSGNSLTGIPATGIGALINSVNYGERVQAVSALTGVAGLTRALLRGATIHVWVQRDDPTAQSVIAAAEGTTARPSTGVYEYLVSDERRNESSLTALCDAYLTLFSYPIVTVNYDTRDVKTKSGKPIVIDLASPPIDESLTIQSVTITEIDLADGLAPRYHVTASSVQYTLEALLRSLTGLVQD